MVSRISTYTYQQNLLNDYTSVQSNLANLQRQVSSGKKASVFQELNGNVERINAMEAQLGEIDQYTSSNSQISSTLQTMGNATDQIQNITDDVIKLLTTAQGATQAQYPIFAQQLQDMLSNVAGLLNTSVAGRYVFSGGKTDTRPVIEPVPSSYSIGIPDSGYYQGDSEVMTARVSNGFLMNYGVKADAQGFQDIIAAINTAITGLGGNNSTPNQTLIKTAFSLANTAADEINGIKAGINANVASVNEANDFLASTKAYLLGIYNENTNTDLAAASTEIATDQSVLQASFQAFARISSLNLADFLR